MRTFTALLIGAMLAAASSGSARDIAVVPVTAKVVTIEVKAEKGNAFSITVTYEKEAGDTERDAGDGIAFNVMEFNKGKVAAYGTSPATKRGKTVVAEFAPALVAGPPDKDGVSEVHELPLPLPVLATLERAKDGSFTAKFRKDPTDAELKVTREIVVRVICDETAVLPRVVDVTYEKQKAREYKYSAVVRD